MADQFASVDVPKNEPLPKARKATTRKATKITATNMDVVEAKLDALLQAQGINPQTIERAVNEAD